MPPNPPSKRVVLPHAAWRKSLVLIAINLIGYGAIYCQNISARQCHNSPTKISVRDYRTKIDTQPMTIICYYYVDTKLIINVYWFIIIDISCQIVTKFSNHIELINRLSTVGRRRHTSIQNLYSVFAGEIVTTYQHDNVTILLHRYRCVIIVRRSILNQWRIFVTIMSTQS